MCGISGITSGGGLCRADIDAVTAMVRHMRHRGPDAEGVHVFPHCALGHNRLAVLDLTPRAKQPMRSHCGRYHLVFNGEIYNFQELKHDLEHKGRVFRTRSDAEVLLECYAAYGHACFPRLNGMFALGIWDAKTRTLTLARDRFGQKPLFYAAFSGRIAFASEVRALFRHPELSPEPDCTAIRHYLSLQSVPAPFSAFSGIRQLPPACLMEAGSDTEPRILRYWNPTHYPMFTGSDAEAEEELDMLLRRSVRRHLVSDAPVGLFLSGGVDSSLIASQCPGGLPGFCVGAEEVDFDESPHAARVAGHCGVALTIIRARPDIAGLLPGMVRHYGEPFADSSALFTWLLCVQAKQGMTVALAGDGADDIFNGYARHAHLMEALSPASRQELADKSLELHRCLEGLDSRRRISPELAGYIFHLSAFCGRRKLDLCQDAACDMPGSDGTLELLLDHLDSREDKHILDAVRRLELQYYLAATLTPKVDVASMAASLEVRMPFLDTELTDFAFSLPAHMRVRTVAGPGSFGNGVEAKWIVKRVAERHLPHDLVYRRKHGFRAPIGEWLRGELKEMAADMLLGDGSFVSRVLNRREVRAVFSEHMEGTADHRHRIWVLLMLELWASECLAPPSVESASPGDIPVITHSL